MSLETESSRPAAGDVIRAGHTTKKAVYCWMTIASSIQKQWRVGLAFTLAFVIGLPLCLAYWAWLFSFCARLVSRALG